MYHKNDPAIERLLEKGIAAARQHSAANGGVLAANTNQQRQQARALLAQVLRADPDNVRAWMWLSRVADSPAEQKLCLKALLARDPDNKRALNTLALLNGDRTPPRLKRRPHRSHARPAAKLRRLPTRAAPERSGSGLPGCPFCRRPVSATGTRCPHCRLPLAMNCPACGQAMDVEYAACDQCGRAMGNYQDPQKYFSRLGQKYLKARCYPDAIKAWESVAVLNPNFPKLHLRLGQAQLGTGRPDRAEKSLVRALQRIPQDPAANFMMAELLRTRGEAERAFTHYQTVIRTKPRQGLAWFRLAGLYDQAGKKRAAKTAYRKAVRWLPSGPKGQALARA